MVQSDNFFYDAIENKNKIIPVIYKELVGKPKR